jgi:hypothetical protein
MGRRLSPALELDILDGDVYDCGLEVVDGSFDGGVEALGEDLGGEGVYGLDGHSGSEVANGPVVE